MTIQQVENAAKVVINSTLPFLNCFDDKAWKNLPADSELSFSGINFIARFMREQRGVEPFRGEPPFLKLECSDESIQRFSLELGARIDIRDVTVHGIGCVPVNSIRASISSGVTLIEPNSSDWEYAQYEISLLYGANPFKQTNTVAILSARVLPSCNLDLTNESNS